AEPVGMSAEPGLPRLPYLVRRIAVPLGSTVQPTTFTPGQAVALQGAGLVEWAQLPQAAGQSPPLPLPTGPDGTTAFTYYPAPAAAGLSRLVAQVPVWPPQAVELASTSQTAGYQVYTLRIYPVQWSPQQGTLRVLTTVSLDLTYVPGPTPAAPAGYAEAMGLEDLKARVSNPGDVAAGPRPLSFPPGPDTRYLIITDNFHWSPDFPRGSSAGNLADEFRRLAEWKSEKGLKASVVTITNIVNGKYGDFTTGARDLPETIRNFLKFAHRKWST